MTALQQQVVKAARKKLEKKSWFRGVCLDNLPDDEYIRRHGFDNAVTDVVVETQLWDDPDCI